MTDEKDKKMSEEEKQNSLLGAIDKLNNNIEKLFTSKKDDKESIVPPIPKKLDVDLEDNTDNKDSEDKKDKESDNKPTLWDIIWYGGKR